MEIRRKEWQRQNTRRVLRVAYARVAIEEPQLCGARVWKSTALFQKAKVQGAALDANAFVEVVGKQTAAPSFDRRRPSKLVAQNELYAQHGQHLKE